MLVFSSVGGEGMRFHKSITSFVFNIVVMGVVLGFLLIALKRQDWQIASPSASGRIIRLIRVGDTVTALPKETWGTNRPTLVIAMQIGCRWCELSASFYRDLLSRDANGAFQIIVAMPVSVSQGKAYLTKLDVNVPDVRQVDFVKLGVHATPTLIVIDGHGQVSSIWEGYLSADRQADLLNELRLSHESIAKHRSMASESATPISQ